MKEQGYMFNLHKDEAKGYKTDIKKLVLEKLQIHSFYQGIFNAQIWRNM